MNRRNIVQFKPEGVANLFSPTIRIQGAKGVNESKVSASNSDTSNNSQVNYPSQRTVTTQRQNMARQQAIQLDHDKLYDTMFGDLLSGDYINTGDDTLSSSPGPIPSGITTDYQILTQVGLTNLASCIEKGGVCVNRDNCHPTNKIGRCFTDNYTCCKKGESESTRTTTAGTMTSGGGTVSMAGAATVESEEDSLTSGYLRWQTSMVGVDDSRPQSGDMRVDESRREQSTVRASTDYNYDNVTSVESDSDPYFCATFCRGGGYDFETGEWKPRPCEGECAKCSNCGKDTEESQTTAGSSIAKILFDNDRYTLGDLNRQGAMDKKFKKCIGLSDNACNADPNCFTCFSTATSTDYSCKKHPDNSRIGVCDTKGAKACVPVYKVNGVDKADTLMPFRTLEDYQDTTQYFNIENKTLQNKQESGLTHILEFPKKCQGPIDREYTYEEQRADSRINRRSYY